MAKYNPAKRGLDEQELEGGATGGGGAGGARASTSGTKWSDRPSFTSNASLMDDIKKINKDTSHLKGNAKKVAEDAQDRAGKRTAIRAAATGAAAAGAKALTSDDYEDTTDNTPSRAGMGEVMSGKGMAKGGSASSRADGIAQRGKTKGRVC
jgi:hypothetical protein